MPENKRQRYEINSFPFTFVSHFCFLFGPPATLLHASDFYSVDFVSDTANIRLLVWRDIKCSESAPIVCVLRDQHFAECITTGVSQISNLCGATVGEKFFLLPLLPPLPLLSLPLALFPFLFSIHFLYRARYALFANIRLQFDIRRRAEANSFQKRVRNPSKTGIQGALALSSAISRRMERAPGKNNL